MLQRRHLSFFTSFLENLPDGVEFLASYNHDTGAYTIWRAPNRETLEKLFKEFPVFSKKAEITEIIQSYPPTVEYTVRMWDIIQSIFLIFVFFHILW
ncbi:hypothetical protein [Thermococcus sp.]